MRESGTETSIEIYETLLAAQSEMGEGFFIHEGGRLLYANEACSRISGYSLEELVALPSIFDLLVPEEKEVVLQRMHRRLEGQAVVEHYESTILHKEGRRVDVEIAVKPLQVGGAMRLVVLMRDVTERRKDGKALAEERNLLRTLIDNMPDFIYVKDAESRFLINNAGHARVMGTTAEDLSGKTDFEFFPRALAERYRADEQMVVRSGKKLVDIEEPVVDHEGMERWYSTTKVPLRDGSGEIKGVVGISRDITERKGLKDQLKHQAFYDSLTGLPNRALFLDRLQQSLARAQRTRQPAALLFIDLDDFKGVNDAMGHDPANTLLVEVSRRLQSCVRPADTLARIYGDEFVILLESPCGAEQAARVTERIEAELKTPFEIEGHEILLTSSVGIAMRESSEDGPEDILRRADLAMYEAKSRGKAQHRVYSPSMATRAAERRLLENELRRAVEREEFEVYYQPIVDLQTRAADGFEALVRWRHPERGLVAASEFIHLAEETGLIRPIGGWVLEKACRQAKEWRARYPEDAPLIMVNLSTAQFAHQADLIPRVLSDTGLDPEGLQLEITERAVMDDAEYAIGKLQRLRGLGVGFAIDDYGMGYSCLYYLKRMPVNLLKIDRSFISGLESDPGDEAIVAGTINLAHALGLRVVAEGVETAAQLASLENLGCDLVQGYHLSVPLSAAGVEDLLKGERRW